MSLTPAFEVGLWNAWIPTTLLFLFIMLSGLLPKDIGKRITPNKEDNKNRRVMLIVFFTMIIYSIFLPLKLGTVWFYAGLAVYVLGFIISTAALFSIAATKPGEPFTTGMDHDSEAIDLYAEAVDSYNNGGYEFEANQCEKKVNKIRKRTD